MHCPDPALHVSEKVQQSVGGSPHARTVGQQACKFGTYTSVEAQIGMGPHVLDAALHAWVAFEQQTVPPQQNWVATSQVVELHSILQTSLALQTCPTGQQTVPCWQGVRPSGQKSAQFGVGVSWHVWSLFRQHTWLPQQVDPTGQKFPNPQFSRQTPATQVCPVGQDTPSQEGVAVGVLVAALVGVSVGVLVGVFVGVFVGVCASPAPRGKRTGEHTSRAVGDGLSPAAQNRSFRAAAGRLAGPR